MISQDLFLILGFLQITLCLKTFLFVCRDVECVNPPKLNIQEVQGTLSFSPNGDTGPLPIFQDFYFCQSTHPADVILLRGISENVWNILLGTLPVPIRNTPCSHAFVFRNGTFHCEYSINEYARWEYQTFPFRTASVPIGNAECSQMNIHNGTRTIRVLKHLINPNLWGLGLLGNCSGEGFRRIKGKCG